MKKVLFILLLSILAIVLASCTSNNQTTDNNSQMPIKEVKVVASCEDNNACTEDIFNQLTQQCEHTRLDHCCGDSVCDSDERCNTNTHKTKCITDCKLACPGFLTITNTECTGKCTKTGNTFVINGDSKIIMELENVGEISVNDVTSNFKCIKENGNTFAATNGLMSNLGMTVKEYFNSGELKVQLSGLPYNKNKATYTLELNGIPQQQNTIKCDTNFGSLGVYVTNNFDIKLQ